MYLLYQHLYHSRILLLDNILIPYLSGDYVPFPFIQILAILTFRFLAKYLLYALPLYLLWSTTWFVNIVIIEDALGS